MESVFESDTMAGMAFMLEMLTVAVAIAMGMMLAQLVLPDFLLVKSNARFKRFNSLSLAAEMAKDQ